jgi:prevent-host-death family protein
MVTVGSYEAKTHLPRLLERVEQGEIITITRHGKPIARLVPVSPVDPRPEVESVIAAMVEFQEHEGPTLGGKLTIRELIEEGRR